MSKEKISLDQNKPHKVTTVKFTNGQFKAKVLSRDVEIVYGALAHWPSVQAGLVKESNTPIPNEYLSMSVGGCATMHATVFCRENKLPVEGITLDVSYIGRPAVGELVNTIILDLKVPEIPKKLEAGLLEAVKNCTMARSISLPPKIIVNLKK